ncbi:rna polymerase sigma-54 factor rpon [hydrocarbon metagenome]|uniref:Rna polymerase sigma-54 factor rpon n=1 Tax=hydrocarbon metagenome TaxID=938273 RepID=A0A0W8EA32_9ZZZZ
MLGERSTKLEIIVYRGWEQYSAGNENAIEDIYPEIMPFCLRVCSKTCGRYINENDEESSIARFSILEAFDTYDPDKGRILGYLGRVIRSRIIDYKRSEKKRQAISIWEIQNDKNGIEIVRDSSIEDIVDEMARKQEIDIFSHILQSYDICFNELAKNSPRHNKTREEAKQIAWKIASEEAYREYLLDKKKLPVKMLEEREMVSRKLVDRYRRYIIANALIIIYDLAYLKPYVLPSKGGA